MSSTAATGNTDGAHKLQQTIKWVVYSLLLINFGFYITEDWGRAAHTLDAGSSLLDWTGEFATSIDESAWFLLLFMFELETYVLEDRQWTRRVALVVHGVRVLCYVMIAHTVYAYAVALVAMQPTVPVEHVTQLCQMQNEGVSFVHNLEYTEVNAETCEALSGETQFFWLADDRVVSDRAGLELERDLALVDLIEATTWLIIILAIELVVRLQERGVTGGPVLTTARVVKFGLYALLIGFGVYWASLSHWLYLWDELLWIGGFAAIEMNVSQWREELMMKKLRFGS